MKNKTHVKDDDILVSILCVTYNHARYVAKALDGFLSQELDGRFEIIIHDDASNDGTLEVLKRYRRQHPDLITLITEKDNQFSRGSLQFMEDIYMRARGRYLAWCEGDDYWTDVRKIQTQVDYMEANKSVSVCFHPVEIRYESDDTLLAVHPKDKSGFTLERLIFENYIQTNSVMYRKLDNYDSRVPADIVPLDWYMHLLHATHGDIGFIDKPMAVYLRHSEGLWWKDEQSQVDFWRRNAIRHIRLFEKMEKLFWGSDSQMRIVHRSLGELIGRICFEVGEKDKYEIATDIARTFPRYVAITVTQSVSEGPEPHLRIQELVDRIDRVTLDFEDRLKIALSENQELTAKLNVIDGQLSDITHSKSWKITRPLRFVGSILGRH